MAIRRVVSTLLLATALPLAAAAGEPHAEPAGQAAPSLALSPKLRAALQAEMVAVRDHTAQLATRIPSGEWPAVAEHAGRIRDGYIMKQKLSHAEMVQLEERLPAEFQALDAAFHRHADGLARAAHAHDYELAVFYFARLLDGCGGCHARYASHRFGGFAGAPAAGHSH